ncbi:MAG: amidohydrolase family protein [Planctomycetota bacterium]
MMRWPLRIRFRPFRWLVLAILAFPVQRVVAEFEVPIALTQVRIVDGTGRTLENGTIVMFKGRIADVGAVVDIPLHAERIDGSGLTVYPGFIDAQSYLGIPEAERTPEERQRTEGLNPDHRENPVPAMHEANRRGIRPQVRAAQQYIPDAKQLEAYRSAGFTAALLSPRDGILGGTSDLVHLNGDPVRGATIGTNLAMHASFQTGEKGEYPETLLGVFALFRQVMLDAKWYAKIKKYDERHSDSTERAPSDAALEALQPVLARAQRVIFEANSVREINRALDLAREFNLDIAISGGREAWKVVDRLKSERVPILVSLKFDEEPEFGKKSRGPGSSESKEAQVKKEDKGKAEKIYEPLKVRQERRRLWEEQVANIIRLQEAGVAFALRTRDFKTPTEFFKNLQLVMERGLSEESAVAALSTTAAERFGPKGQLGSIAPGRLANLTLMNKPLGQEKAEVKMVFIDGKKFEIDRDETKPDEKAKPGESSTPASTSASTDASETSAPISPATPSGGPEFAAEILADRIPKMKTGGDVLIRNATIIPITAATLPDGSILIRGGKIAAIGKEVTAPEGVSVIDGSGCFVIPGIIDCHSHLALDAVNEAPLAISAEVRIADVVDPDHVSIHRALAGGTTTHHAMHGSANPIGGQNVVCKLKYRRPVSEMIVADAPRTIKFALGENVKQSNFHSAWDKRFPNSRMGVETTFRSAFERSVEYQTARDEFQTRTRSGEDVAPVRRDLRLEALADILSGQITVHCHCYRSEEILRLFDVAEDFGFRIGTLHHVLEGYRIAPEIARHGSGASTFSNFWAYKVEAYGAIPHNAAFMTKHGICTTVNSDSPDTIRYMGQEAAKGIRWGGSDENEALRLVTMNAARQLQIDHRVGSLEVGKDGDIALFNGHPLNSFSRCVMTVIEGEVYFEDGRFFEDRTKSSEKMAERSALPIPIAIHRTIPQTPHRAYAIVNATIHPMRSRDEASEVLQGGTVVILEDRIHAVGASVDVPPGAGIIDGAGLHVYPGLIDAGGTLGLSEIGFVRATEDYREIGSFNPQLSAITAIHPHSEHVRIARGVGITTAVAKPTGGRISGQSAVLHLTGWTAAEMTIVPALALHMSVPSLPIHLTADSAFLDDDGADHADHCTGGPSSRSWLMSGAGTPDEDEAKKKQKDDYKKSLNELEDYLARAKQYARAKDVAAADPGVHVGPDLELEALLPYVRGEKPVFLEAGGYKQILETIEFAEKHKLRMVLVGGAESWKLAAQLAEKKISVVLSSPTTMPANEFEPWDSVYRCAGELDRAGVPFCFGAGSAADAYNMPIEVAMAVAHGLSRDRAEYTVTRGAAEIIGLSDRRGSIEVGKQADLIVTTDSPLQAINQVTHMFIDGKPIDLANMHTENYEKFWNRPAPKLPVAKELRGPKSLTKK